MNDQSMGRTERTVNPSAYPLVDPEFAALLPPLTSDQKAGLEKLIVAAGRITHPLAVWAEERLLVDGHNRLEIATRLGLGFRTEELSFPSREAAIEWIFANQRDRRNLTPDQLALVMGRHYNRTKKPGGSGWRKGHDDQNERRAAEGSADERIAEKYGVSLPTVRRNGRLAAAVETLKAVDPEIEQKVVTGKGPTRKAVIAAAEAGPEEAKAILAGASPAPKPKREKAAKETLADRRGFKRLPLREASERAEAAVMMLETALEGIGDINPERLNGERQAFAERLCKAAHSLNRMTKAWKGDAK